MAIPEGKKVAAAAFDKFYEAPNFDWGTSLPELLAVARTRAAARANASGIIYDFKKCGSGIGYGVGSQEISAWEMSLLLAEYAAGTLAQKAAEGHCATNAPCHESSAEHLEMLEDFRKQLHGLVDEIADLIVRIKGLKAPAEQRARDLGLRD
jgi:hypothetical protein